MIELPIPIPKVSCIFTVVSYDTNEEKEKQEALKKERRKGQKKKDNYS